MDTELSQIGSEINEAPSTAGTDKKAALEAKFFGDEHRKEETKQTLHSVFLVFIRIAAFAFIALFVIRMGHFMLPETYCWLDEKRIQAIDKSLFSGALGGLVMNYIKQAFPVAK